MNYLSVECFFMPCVLTIIELQWIKYAIDRNCIANHFVYNINYFVPIWTSNFNFSNWNFFPPFLIWMLLCVCVWVWTRALFRLVYLPFGFSESRHWNRMSMVRGRDAAIVIIKTEHIVDCISNKWPEKKHKTSIRSNICHSLNIIQWNKYIIALQPYSVIKEQTNKKSKRNDCTLAEIRECNKRERNWDHK